MQEKTIKKVLITIIVVLAIIMTSTYTFAGVAPSQITGESDGDIDLTFLDDITDMIRVIGIFIAVGAMMVIGIKYVTGSIEEKANYKKSMMPYVIGCFVLFGASYLAPEIKDLFSDIGTDTETIGNKVLGIIQVVGTIATVAVLMILGIKYMVGSVEERASYKKTMLPYIIGAILIFAAVNLTAMIYNIVPEAEIEYSATNGQKKAQEFLNEKTSGYADFTDEQKEEAKTAIKAEYDSAVEKRNAAYKEDPESEEYEYWKTYAYDLYEYYRWM